MRVFVFCRVCLCPTPPWGLEHLTLKLLYHHAIGVDDYLYKISGIVKSDTTLQKLFIPTYTEHSI